MPPLHSFPRGAIPTPRNKLAAAEPHRVIVAPPAQFTIVPKQLSYWLNEQYGDCVTAEEAFAVAWYSVFLGLQEIVISDQVVYTWCRQNGVLHGADLLSVIQQMQRSGFQVGNQLYNDGTPSSVDYGDETVLQSAISQGTVKLGIDANALPGGAGNGNGWFITSGGSYRNEDHCVSVPWYGRADYLFDSLKLPLPSGLSPSTPGYHVFTWNSIGFVVHDWIMGCAGEGWLRTPTKVGVPPLTPPTPNPPSPIPPTPTPSVNMLTISIPLGAGQYPIGSPAVGTLIVPVTVLPGTYPI